VLHGVRGEMCLCSLVWGERFFYVPWFEVRSFYVLWFEVRGLFMFHGLR
jgi:hypothetical protein